MPSSVENGQMYHSVMLEPWEDHIQWDEKDDQENRY